MFSIQQKRDIADAVQKILRATNHPELPQGEIPFSLHVDGAEAWSWADIRNNGAVASGSADRAVKLAEITDNAWDIGVVAGVLRGIELTPTLLSNQKEAVADARKAIARIAERNRIAMTQILNPPNS